MMCNVRAEGWRGWGGMGTWGGSEAGNGKELEEG